MRIIKGADQASEKWTVRKFLEKLEVDEINLDVDIQRGFVWKKDRERCSLLIRSLILERFVPPLYFNKVGSVYECLDGKQRSDTIKSFFDDEFELCGLDEFEVVNDDGASEIIDINGCIYSELPECLNLLIYQVKHLLSQAHYTIIKIEMNLQVLLKMEVVMCQVLFQPKRHT